MSAARRRAERATAALGTVAPRARDALRSSYRLPRGIEKTVQHLADRAVLSVERVGVHVGDERALLLIFERNRSIDLFNLLLLYDERSSILTGIEDQLFSS